MEELDFLINELIKEEERYSEIKIPVDYENKRRLLRSLMNIRMPREISKEFLKVQDRFLAKEVLENGVVDVSEISTVKEYLYGDLIDEIDNDIKNKLEKISIWQGDITRLSVDAIVNAANSEMLGCFIPCHRCIDNAIHSQAGIELREECFEIMKKQGEVEPTGSAKITKGYNLPAKHVIHTVGPIVSDGLTAELREDLKSSYESSLNIAVENNIRTIAFCCISTGEFHFPNSEAAKIAIKTVFKFLDDNIDKIDRIIFNVFKDIDYDIYRNLIKEKYYK